MKRREFITLIGGAAAVGWTLAARAQLNAMPVIGYLSTRSTESERPMLAAFTRSLGDMGYVLDKNVAIEFRSGNGQYDLLRTLAEDLVRRQVAVIVAAGGSHPAFAAKAATTKIPIVFNVGDDPVQVGLVASLSRPGGNATGVASLLAQLGAKQLGLIQELVPKATVVAILVNPLDPWTEAFTADTRAAARALGQQLVILKASSEREIDAAFAALRQQGVGALLVNGGPLFVTQANQVIALAAHSALPAIYFRREFADAGGLMSYGSSTAELYGQMGVYVGKILNGAKPADLPVVQPTKFELVINLKTAKALGLEVPLQMQQLADGVIE
jgi:putative ABC transport system substrate-binding protein